MNGGLPGFRTPSDSCRSRIFLLRFDSKRLPLRLPFSLCCCSTPSPASEAAAATRRHVVAVFLGCEAWSGGAAQGRQVRLQPLQACEASRGGSPAALGGSTCAAPPGARAGGSGAGRGGGSGVARVCRHHAESRKQKSLGLLCSK